MPEAVPYRQFKVLHPEHDARYWARCRALYSGGRRLLGDDATMRDVFPQHPVEAQAVYEQRRRRAYYINYAGSIIDMIVAELFAEQFSLTGQPAPDAFYSAFFDDCSRPGGAGLALNDLLKQQVLTALQLRRAWTMVELPEHSGPTPADRLDEERRGLRGAYCSAVEPECVRDWEHDPDGELLWVLLAFERRPRPDLLVRRDHVEEELVWYSRDEWVRWQIQYPTDKPPPDNELIPPVASGVHSFGAVPVLPLELPAGLWAMGKLESLAAAHMNQRVALSWAQHKSLYPFLAHFAGPEDPANPATADPDRAINQTYGQGYIARFPVDDRIQYISPDSSTYQFSRDDLATLRDEMYRVVHHMAMSVDNSAAALQRSAASKSVDRGDTATVLRALGQVIVKHVLRVLELVGCGRRDPAVTWTVKGMDSFDSDTLASLLEMAQILDTVEVPSAAFQVDAKFKLAKAYMGTDVDVARLALYRKELEMRITN